MRVFGCSRPKKVAGSTESRPITWSRRLVLACTASAEAKKLAMVAMLTTPAKPGPPTVLATS